VTTMLEDAIRIQRVATDPDHSAWVEANAGSGKTHVLVDRIARLLLEGSPPDRLLCLTFTRAAAAEMLARLFKRLGDWTMQSDEALAKSLQSLTGAPASAQLVRRARRLFADALESPGGLRIQTIHAFCERLLKRFPLEAGVAPQFTVLDDNVSNELLSDARDELLRLAQSDQQLADDIYELTAHSGEERFDQMMRAVARDRGILTKFLTEQTVVDKAVAAIFARAGARQGTTEIEIFERASALLTPDLARRIANAYAKTGKPTDAKRILPFRAFAAKPTIASFKDVIDCFLTEKGALNSSLATKGARDADREAMERIDEIARAGFDATIESNALFVADRTSRLVRVASRMLERFTIAKRRRAALDYDDLIVRVRTLFDDPGADWILYKLDGGIDHILVDEAQDTSPMQWEVITPIAEEFFAGHGAERKGQAVNRTLFAVGDVKQSIMSFQGADPEAFVQTRKLAEKTARGAHLGFENVTLDRSFRSAPQILHLVDAVFANEAAQEGVAFEDQPVAHIAIREDVDGVVELWPAIEASETPEPVAWDAPRDRPTDRHPPVILAQMIADRIGEWIKNGEAVYDHQTKTMRRMNAGDVMILVRRRGFFAEEMIRQLKKRAIPVAGADRLQLVSHIAIKDLIALGRFALLPRDDLNLAALLKSPFCGVSEQALFELAYDRGKSSLWDRLRECSNDMVFRTAADFLESVRNEADYKQPFEFYADILSAQGGWRHVLERLGLDAADPIDEFMNAALEYEADHTPSLEGFLHWIETTDAEIKRDQDRTAGAVRVMTVHAAKGLEAPVVILPDTCTTPESGQHDQDFLNAENVPLWRIEPKREIPPRRAAREAAKRQRMMEYRRLLYVALTRPRDRLYVCGFQTKRARGREDGCWYDLVEAAMQKRAALAVTIGDTTVHRLGTVPDLVAQTARVDVADMPLPTWIKAQATSERLPQPINPSDAVRSSHPAALSASRKIELGPALERGRVIHRLLELLAPLDQSLWSNRARAFAKSLIDDRDIAVAAADEALRVRADPSFRHLFGPGSQGEVSLRGSIAWQGKTVDLVARVDRIVVEPARVLIIEFKTDRTVPKSDAGVSSGYVTQLALYARAAAALFPDRDVECAILWTAEPRLDTISSRKLEAAERALDPLWAPS
jgi:ATP-dependent helicase/nuclease subunit A